MKSDRVLIERMLKTARGQIDGILKMVEDDRYCVDISNQLMATTAILRKINSQILHDHLENCVQRSFEEGDQKEKIQEIMMIIDKLSR